MNADEIEAALRELGFELQRRSVKAKLWVVGGATIILSFHSRENTLDVDMAASPREEVLQAAGVVASKLGLQTDWLNDHASAFIPPTGSERWLPVRNYGPVLEVFLADPRMVLAMKLRAARDPRDRRDVELLVGACGIRSEDEGIGVYEEFFPEDPITQMGRMMLHESIEKVREGAVDFDLEDLIAGAPFANVSGSFPVARSAADSPRSHSPNEDVWAWSVRGSVAHRISGTTGDELFTHCRHRLLLVNVKIAKSPKKRSCEVCARRRLH